MRIAIAHYYWDYPESEYGLPAALVKRGNRVILTVWKGDSGETSSYSVGGFRVFMLPGMNVASPLRLGVTNPYVLGIRDIYDRFSPDIVDCQSHLFFTTIESLKEARRRGVPAVVTVRGVMAKRDFLVNSAQRVYLYTLASSTFKGATLVRCLTDSDAREVERYGCPRERIRVIPNFVDTDTFAPSSDGGDGVLWYGRFVEEKGLTHLVRAAKAVADKDKGASFTLAGDGPQAVAIRSLAEGLGLGGRLTMPGKMARERLIPLIKRSSIVVVPSIKEGMPFSLLEAMSSGKAVVASDIPGINDVITDGEDGILVPPGDPSALAEAILALRGDEGLRKKLGANARSTILGRFSERAVLDRVEAMYREARDLGP